MKRRPVLTFELLVYFSTYPLLLVLLVTGGLVCHLTFNLAERITQEPPPTAPRRWVKLPPITVKTPFYTPTAISQQAVPTAGVSVSSVMNTLTATLTPASVAKVNIDSPTKALSPTNPDNTPVVQQSVATPALAATTPATYAPPTPTMALDFDPYTSKGAPVRTPRPKATPTPTAASYISEVVASLMQVIDEPTLPAKISADALPTLTPTPTSTATPSPTATFTPTPIPTQTSTPTNTPSPTVTRPPTVTPTPSATPTPTKPPPPTPSPLSTNTPEPTPTQVPEYDFMLAEFYNSPTTNAFLVMYVAILDPSQIPIGDIKVVGTRLDHNLTYESPLSTWHFEGYNAPGEVRKSGNLKFEPPGGIENTAWIIHLEDPQGKRLSADVPFDTSQNDKQWYFVRFQRRF